MTGQTTLSRKILRVIGSLVPMDIAIPIVRGPLKGMKWISGAAAGPGKGLSVVVGKSEAAQMESARLIVNDSSICFDIGANVGQYTLLFSRYGKFVYSFEPLPRNIHYLWKTLQVNRVNNAIIVPCAVSDIIGACRFDPGAHNSEGRLTSEGVLPVAAVTLDSFCRAAGAAPDVIKIDVEGGELAVLMGGAGTLGSSRPAVLLSTHGDERREQCLDYLQKMGYQRISPLNGDTIDSATEFLCESRR